MRRIDRLFEFKRQEDDFNRFAKNILRSYLRNSVDDIPLRVLIDIDKRKDLLLGYLKYKHVPVTTNLIESYNSHLQGRLKTIQSFKSFSYANHWLNGYFLRRRFRIFTDCKGRFRHLNGKSSIQISKRRDVDLPRLF